MPRIAVAVGVFALIVFSIGFNTARYSMVWEMAGDSPQPSQPNQPSHSAAASQSETTAQSRASWDSPAAEPEATGYDDQYGYATQQAEEVEPSSRYLARVDPAQASVPSASVIRVVGVSGADVRQNSAAHRDSGSEVCRLPPIDQVAPFTVDRRAPSPGEPLPVYPSSGI